MMKRLEYIILDNIYMEINMYIYLETFGEKHGGLYVRPI